MVITRNTKVYGKGYCISYARAIVMEFGEDKIYAFFADEYTDVTQNKLMIVMIRYFNSLTDKILERTIITVKVNYSRKLFNTVVHMFSRVNLDVKQYRA